MQGCLPQAQQGSERLTLMLLETTSELFYCYLLPFRDGKKQQQPETEKLSDLPRPHSNAKQNKDLDVESLIMVAVGIELTRGEMAVCMASENFRNIKACHPSTPRPILCLVKIPSNKELY